MKKDSYVKFRKAFHKKHKAFFQFIKSTSDLPKVPPGEFLAKAGFSNQDVNNFLKELDPLCKNNRSLDKDKICLLLNLLIASEKIKPQKGNKQILKNLVRLEEDLKWFSKSFPDYPILINGFQYSSLKIFDSIKNAIKPLKGYAGRHSREGKRGSAPNYLRRACLSELFLNLVYAGLGHEHAYSEIVNLRCKLEGSPTRATLPEANKIKSVILDERKRLGLSKDF